MYSSRKNVKTSVFAFAIMACLAVCSTAYAQSTAGMTAARENILIVPLFHSVSLQLDQPAARISVGSPDIADILILRASQLYVIGKDLGTTNLLLWDANDNLIGSYTIQITHDLEDLKKKFHEMLPNEPIEVYSAQRSLVLRGTVSSIGTMNAAISIAEGYLVKETASTETTEFEGGAEEGGEIINLLQVGGGQQVMLEVKIAEISRRELKRLDAQFNALSVNSSRWVVGGVNGGASFPDALFGDDALRTPVFSRNPFGPAVKEFLPNDMSIANQGLFASFLSNSLLFNLAIDAAREKGLAKILAEPTLTTLTGERASFLSGGEFPVPVPGGVNGNTVEYKEFGIQLEFLPIVLGSGKINLKLNVSVSEIENFSPSGLPIFKTRSANVTLEMNDGQTMGIAGLINEDLREVITQFPGLGSIPILGALFRSQEFQNNETELVILVTPRLAKPLDGDLRLPTDGFVEPSDLEFYLLGRLEGRTRKTENQTSANVDFEQAPTNATLAQQDN